MRVRSGGTGARAPSAALGETTLFFTDIEGSTRLLADLGDDAYADLLAVHHDVIRAAIAAHDGEEQGTEGDSFFATFSQPADGVDAAIAAQRGLDGAPWPGAAEVRVRMGVHHGPVSLVGGNLVGMAIHMAARIEAAAHGGQIVVSPAVALGLGSEVPLRALGAHRLRGIAGRTELFQVDLPDLRREFPPLRTEPSGGVPVPRFLAAFVGRAGELEALRRLHSEARVLTITGPPGVGKTRLAVTLADDGPDVAFVDLTSLQDPASLPDRMAAAVGIASPGDDGLDALVRHLGTVPFVLLVDNCEHVIDAAANAVGELLARAPGVRFVCTSREPLAIEGEVVWPLEPLREGEELFVARARAADASSALTADDPRVVAIVERLDRLPLAIELAAAQVARMPLGEVVAGLDQLGGRLRSARRDVPARHRTLLDAIDWSVRLLEPEEQAAFRRLAVMRGPFDLSAAEAVTGAAPDTIAALHERSLLSVGDRVTWGRFRMLQTVRDVAAEMLDAAEERERAEAAHATAFLDRARDSLRELHTSIDALGVLDRDSANYLQAVEWSTVNDPASALVLSVDLEPLWTTRLSPRLGADALERVLDATPDARGQLRAAALMILVDLARNCGRVRQARAAAQEALDIGGDTARHGRFGSAAIALGQILALQGETEDALRLFERHLALSRELGDVPGMVTALREVANIAVEENRPADAVEPLAEACRLALADDQSRWMLGILTSDRGRASLALGQLDEARADFESSMARGQELGIPRAIAGCSIGLAQLERLEGRPERGRALLREALTYYRAEGDAGGLAHVYVEAALVNAAAGAYDVAVQLLGAADALRERIGIAAPGSEQPHIRAARSAAEAELGGVALRRLEQAGRAATEEVLAAFV